MRFILLFVLIAGFAFGQNPGETHKAKKHSSAKHDIGSGAGDIGKGAGKGVAHAAVGTGKAAVDLATLHPIGAAADLGKGAAGAGRSVGVGAVKGSAKILRGTGKVVKHVF